MATNMARNNPMIMAALEKNCFEHISLMAQEQVEIEFRQEMQQIMAIRQNPQAAMNPQIQMQVKMTAEKIAARKAQMIAAAYKKAGGGYRD